MLSRFALRSIRLLCFAGALISCPALAGDTINEKASILPGHSITPQDEAHISSVAVKVPRHIADARGDLRGNSPQADKAKTQLENAEKLLEIIQAELPATKVKDRVRVAKKHLEYEDTREMLPDLVPIYTGCDELVSYMPTAKAKGHLDEAEQTLVTEVRDLHQLIATGDKGFGARIKSSWNRLEALT